MGASIHAAAGHANWLASDAAQYVAIGTRLSADAGRLAQPLARVAPA